MSEEIYVVKAAEIEAMEGVAKAHFLNPIARRVNKSLGDVTGLSGIGVHLIEVQPGCETTEYHRHFHEDEAMFILSGSGVARIGEDEVPVGPGDFLGFRKGGLAHSIRVTGDVPMRCLVVGARLPHDVGDYPDKGKRIYRNEGLPWTVVDHAHLEEPQGVGKK